MTRLISKDFVRSRRPNLQTDQTSLAFIFPYLFYIHFEKFMQRIKFYSTSPKIQHPNLVLGAKKFCREQEPKNYKQCDFASNYSKHILQFRIVESMHYFRLQEISTPLLHTSIKLPELKKIDKNPFFHHNTKDYSVYHYQTNIIFFMSLKVSLRCLLLLITKL